MEEDKFHTVAEFDHMAIPVIVEHYYENKWVVLLLQNGTRIKFKNW